APYSVPAVRGPLRAPGRWHGPVPTRLETGVATHPAAAPRGAATLVLATCGHARRGGARRTSGPDIGVAGVDSPRSPHVPRRPTDCEEGRPGSGTESLERQEARGAESWPFPSQPGPDEGLLDGTG